MQPMKKMAKMLDRKSFLWFIMMARESWGT